MRRLTQPQSADRPEAETALVNVPLGDHTHGRYFIHRRVGKCTVDSAHQLESRRYELAIGLVLGGLQGEQTSIRMLHYVEQKNYETTCRLIVM